MFIKSYLMKIAFLLVFLTGAVPTYSAVLLADHQSYTPLLQELDISGQDKKKAVPLMVFAQNQPGGEQAAILAVVNTGRPDLSATYIVYCQPLQVIAFQQLFKGNFQLDQVAAADHRCGFGSDLQRQLLTKCSLLLLQNVATGKTADQYQCQGH